MTNLSQEIEKLSEIHGFEIDSITQRNKICKLNIKVKLDTTVIPRVQNNELIKIIKSASFVSYVKSYNFKNGKKEEGYDYYFFTISLKYQYFDGRLDTSKPIGNFMRLIKEKNITTVEQFVNSTVGMIRDLSKYAHTLPYKERRELRFIKKAYIKFLYNNKFINSINEQKSYSDDVLVEFKMKDMIFHLRKEQVDFIICSNEIGINSEIYEKRTIDVDSIDYEFKKYLNVLQNVNDTHLFATAEISTPTVRQTYN